jgi:hypothetical protein
MWKKVIEEATERLKSAHPDRNVWLIVAIGLKWMVFYWDPSNSRTNPLPLAIMMNDSTGGWAIDPHIHLPPQPVNNQVPDLDARVQHYVHPPTGIIYPSNAISLDFWTMDPNLNQPRNLGGCMLLEDVFRAVQGDVYTVPANPAGMS